VHTLVTQLALVAISLGQRPPRRFDPNLRAHQVDRLQPVEDHEHDALRGHLISLRSPAAGVHDMYH
jgi:hypothetical protein